MLRNPGLALVLIFLLSTLALSQTPAPLITNIEHRNAISLNGEWHAIVDMYDSGYNGYRGPVDPKNTFFANAKPKLPKVGCM